VHGGNRLVLLIAAIAVSAPAVPAATAFAGGDPPPEAPPSTSPPGPWAGHAHGGGPYVPSATRGCATVAVPRAGPGRVLGLYVHGEGCGAGRRLVRAYRRCAARRCYRQVQRRCVQPEFLGGCRRHDRFFLRWVRGHGCIERRSGRIRRRYDATVVCRRGGRRVEFTYTLFTHTAVSVRTESELRAAWGNPRIRAITVTADIVLRACRTGDPIRESSVPIRLDGTGHTLRQGCFEKRLLRQDGTGFVELRSVTLTRGGSDGPGAAVTTRGEIAVIDSTVKQNLSEEPGGGIMSQRRATVIRSVIVGNLANDDGGGVYARRGGIQVYDSVVSGNLVDGSGGALGSTGDILVVRSHLDGNTTDGDGGAIYTDEDGDVTVIDSTVNGSTADGPGGAIFTLDGDVTIINSTLSGNRADDRGGAISGEAAVTVINSTISRNLAVAHVGGGIWARGDLYLANSTVADNYAEAKGGGLVAAGVTTLVNATVAGNVASVAANVGVGERLVASGSAIGPAKVDHIGGQTQPTGANCDSPATVSLGFNVVTDGTCGLRDATDVVSAPTALGPLSGNGGPGETLLPGPGSPVIDRIPPARCLDPLLPQLLEGEQHLDGIPGDVRTLLATDERGVPRPQGTGCDAGAVEVVR
jgi:hypothetical protein